MKTIPRSCALALALALVVGGTAFGHKVNLFAYVESGTVYTESYFPDGRPVEGGKVLVYDGSGALMLEGTTDERGLFRFPISRVDDLTIVIEASMGHRNSYKLRRSELEAGR